MIFGDTETERFSEHLKAPGLVCASVAWHRTGGPPAALLFKWDGDGLVGLSAPGMFSTILAQPSGWLNAPYDWAVVAAKWPALVPSIFAAYAGDRIIDIGIREKLFDIAHGKLLRPAKGKPHPYSLGELSRRILGREMDKGADTWRTRYGELKHVPLAQWPEAAKAYPLGDVVTPLEVFDAQNARPYAAEILAPQFREARADWGLHLMHCWGFRTDQIRLEKFAKEVGDEYAILHEVLVREGLIRVKQIGGKNPRTESSRNVKAVRDRLQSVATAHGLDVKMTSGGDKGSEPEVSTDADTCKMLAEHDPVLRSYARYSSLGSLLSKDVVAFRGHLQIHPNFDSLNMNGRTSSFKPNTQNPPRVVGIRESFVPRPGCVFIDNDYPQIELRTWAQVCIWVLGYSRMAELLNTCDADGKYNPLDPHLDLGSRILRIPYAEAKARLKAEKAALKLDPKAPAPVSDARQISKVGNFGYMGGMGWETFIGYAREQFDIVLEKNAAKALHQGWLENWPEAKPYFAWIKGAHEWSVKLSAKGKPIKVTSIRHFVSGMIRGGAVYTDACNNYFSALAQCIGKEAMFQIARECYDESTGSILLGCRPVNWVHDQIIAECPDDELAHDRAIRVAQIMDEAAERLLPNIKTKSEPCLARRWSKHAEAVYDARGRLIPWEEKKAA